MGLITPQIREFVDQQKLGFVATVCPDGSANLSPKGTTIAWDENHLAFADIHSPGTVDNLRLNPSIEINFVDFFTRKGYRFKGTGTVFSDGQIFDDIVSYYSSRGSTHSIRHVVLVKVDRVLPVISPAYDKGLSEEVVTRRWVDYWSEIHPKSESGKT
jgi:predicted pyridoxine 5'-phosphate oxidase superfamily flavin-nucleotide-binding protein